MREGFLVDLHTTMVFFRYCHWHKVTGEMERVAVFRRMVAKKKARYLRDVGEFIQGKKVAVVRRKDNS